ncbi:hypothetical protein TPHA_0D03810 [Tetrapisispora phaffii CBS 4417]|uniref:DM2 domain-containing protein n=1 Tax=Tetrapisispora phaffii (strain ATCC 24235 / CBS 4417 / NBRC 1672 / NRRL Y-8282 / UCD 70-5) TaxID=1071381 RepID=G8BT43_TETPH|nr:hypothetical protein TPHA_0D03810 [Tetrapisispora phaffii CBS 4417]CCE63014.1 hypothetical protein TPHA_0D03810 [Tetrapisispora phaffii CBS 4417]
MSYSKSGAKASSKKNDTSNVSGSKGSSKGGKNNGTVANNSSNNNSSNDNTAAANNNTVKQQMNPISTQNPIDTYIPSYLSRLVPELNSYEQLLDAEKKIDIYLARKKIDLNQNIMQWSATSDSMASSMNSDKKSFETKFLRVFIFNTAENQPWQDESQDLSNASWTLRIEGRLLDSEDISSESRKKFSSYFQGIAVDFKKSKETAAPLQHKTESNTEEAADVEMTDAETIENQKENIIDAVEWNFDAKNPVQFDGLDMKRPGSENLDCTITLQLQNMTGSVLEYSSQLASIIGFAQGSIQDAVYFVYKYLLINNLLTKEPSLKSANNNSSASVNSTTNSNDQTNGDNTVIQIDSLLSELILPDPLQTEYGFTKPSTLTLNELLALINKHVSPMKPIKVDYTIKVDKSSTYGDVVFDIAVQEPVDKNGKIQNKDSLSSEAISLLTSIDNQQSEMKSKLDELHYNSRLLHLQLNESAKKYQFFHKIAENPVPALKEYIESSSNALKVLSGDEGYNEDMVRRSQFYKDNEDVLFENLGVLLANGRM